MTRNGRRQRDVPTPLHQTLLVVHLCRTEVRGRQDGNSQSCVTHGVRSQHVQHLSEVGGACASARVRPVTREGVKK